MSLILKANAPSDSTRPSDYPMDEDATREPSRLCPAASRVHSSDQTRLAVERFASIGKVYKNIDIFNNECCVPRSSCVSAVRSVVVSKPPTL
ncbi:unnamed protein product [Leptosia nina]|uniref:Uncharacterized protein n=1 Tax=Leptosia nina TaxID=320188 RepID=A0AAV1IXM9_9NEOP